jgi:starvation-inducible DNA-binding protein
VAAKTEAKRSNGAAKATSRFATSIDVPPDAREKLNKLLNQQLADTADLFSQIKHAHWNIKGAGFIQLHLLFDKLAECALEWSDLIAERVAQLGGYALGTVRMAAAASKLPEFPLDATDSLEHVRALVRIHANYAASTRAAIEQSDKIGDPTTADLFTEISRDVDKNLWFLEAHLQA